LTYKIGVIGDKESVLPFKLFGFMVYYGNDLTAIIQSFDRMVEENFGIIYITEACALQIPERIRQVKNKISTTVVLIPGHEGSKGIGKEEVEKNMKKAVGQNIL